MTRLDSIRPFLQWLGSPRWMLAFFVFAIASALVALQQPDWITTVWIVPLGVFAVSLLAAVATNARLRCDPALLGLHLGLLALVVLVALARLTYLDGAVTLTQGNAFDGQLHLDRRGPLHPPGIEQLRFANEGFTEDFYTGARWKSTYNRVRWWDASGASQVAEIGDDRPLLLGGYRIYTSFNRGYSPMFSWQPTQGGEEIGTVQLRAGELDMANDWQLPGGPKIWAMLDLPTPATLTPGERRANLNSAQIAHRLVIRSGERREVLQQGQSMDFAQGRLTYLSLSSWMGYRVIYDVAMYWMAAATVLVVACMMAFYARLLGRNWADKTEGEAACD